MIIVNRIQCLNCKDIITSRYRHDYVSCKCRNVAVDGGYSYLKRTGEEYKEMSITGPTPFEKVREVFERWNVKTGEWVSLKDMSDEWLEAVIIYNIDKDISNSHSLFYLEEKQYRNEVF